MGLLFEVWLGLMLWHELRVDLGCECLLLIWLVGGWVGICVT